MANNGSNIRLNTLKVDGNEKRGGSWRRRGKFFTCVVDTSSKRCHWYQWQIFRQFIDTGGAHWLMNISENLKKKNLKWPQCYFQELWGRWFMRKKPESKNIVTLPFKSATWLQFYNFVKMPHTGSRLVRWHGISALCTLPFPSSFITYASLIHLPEPSKPYQIRQLPAQFCPPPPFCTLYLVANRQVCREVCPYPLILPTTWKRGVC